jgi:hypothetical protein
LLLVGRFVTFAIEAADGASIDRCDTTAGDFSGDGNPQIRFARGQLLSESSSLSGFFGTCRRFLPNLLDA